MKHFPANFPARPVAGKRFSLPGDARRQTQAIDCKQICGAARALFRPGGEFFPCVSRAAGKRRGGVAELVAARRSVMRAAAERRATRPKRNWPATPPKGFTAAKMR